MLLDLLAVVRAVVLILLATYEVASWFAPRLPDLPVGFFVIWLACGLLQPFVDHIGYGDFARGLGVLSTLSLTFGCIRTFVFIVERVVGQRLKIVLPTITRDVLLVIIYVIAIMVVLRQRLGVDVSSLVATSAVLTAVIGLALQETLGSLFSGLALHLEKPYKLGDWVAFEKYRGNVRGMGWRSTTLITTDREIITIPNNVISRGQIVNYSDPSTIIVAGCSIGLEYAAAPERVIACLKRVIVEHPGIRQDHAHLIDVRVQEFADSAIRYEMRYPVDIAQGLSAVDRVRSILLSRLWYELRRSGITVPFPIQMHMDVVPPDAKALCERIELRLREVPLFAELTPEYLTQLATGVQQQLYAPGEMIVREGESGDCMYVVLAGTAMVTTQQSSRDTVVLATLGAGDFFGEMSLLTGEPRTATVCADSDVELLCIGKAAMQTLMRDDPRVSEQMSEVLAGRASHRQFSLAAAEANAAAQSLPTAKQLLTRIRDFFRVPSMQN